MLAGRRPAFVDAPLIGARLAAVSKARIWLARFGCRVAQASERWLRPSMAMHLIAHSEKRWGEPELSLLPMLANRTKLAIDIGAADGVYSYFLHRLALECHAFEANPGSARRIRRRVPGVTVHACALSDHHGELELRVPSIAGVALNGWGTVEPANTFSALPDHEVAYARIPCATLDSFQLSNVGFIKIDVEGHEFRVLSGAHDTLRRCRPNLLIEAEDRHRPGTVVDVCGFLAALDYRGWFLNDGALLPLERIFARDPVPSRYVNNIIFIPAERSAANDPIQAVRALGHQDARAVCA